MATISDDELPSRINSLPPEARRQALDFIIFLGERAGGSDTTRQCEPHDLAHDDFIGMWADREYMEKSTAWVRGIRAGMLMTEGEWK